MSHHLESASSHVLYPETSLSIDVEMISVCESWNSDTDCTHKYCVEADNASRK